MSERSDRAERGAEILRLAVNRRGWSAPELSRQTSEAISPASALAYINGRTVPTAVNAHAVARTLDKTTGVELLKAYGYPDLADAYADGALPAEEPEVLVSGPAPSKQSEAPDSGLGLGATLTVVGQFDSDGETVYLLRADDGTILEAHTR